MSKPTIPILPLGTGMTAQEWDEHLQQFRDRFLAKHVRTLGAPFPGIPELRLPQSGIADLNFTGGETEGLV